MRLPQSRDIKGKHKLQVDTLATEPLRDPLVSCSPHLREHGSEAGESNTIRDWWQLKLPAPLETGGS